MVGVARQADGHGDGVDPELSQVAGGNEGLLPLGGVAGLAHMEEASGLEAALTGMLANAHLGPHKAAQLGNALGLATAKAKACGKAGFRKACPECGACHDVYERVAVAEHRLSMDGGDPPTEVGWNGAVPSPAGGRQSEGQAPFS